MSSCQVSTDRTADTVQQFLAGPSPLPPPPLLLLCAAAAAAHFVLNVFLKYAGFVVVLSVAVRVLLHRISCFPYCILLVYVFYMACRDTPLQDGIFLAFFYVCHKTHRIGCRSESTTSIAFANRMEGSGLVFFVALKYLLRKTF